MTNISYDFKDVENELAMEIGILRTKLAIERAQKNAVIRYVESLEQENGKLKEEIKKAKSNLEKLEEGDSAE